MAQMLTERYRERLFGVLSRPWQRPQAADRKV
jgi:hypothetical protein